VTGLAPVELVLLLAWGIVVALDLVSGPQALLARPLVAGTVAGLLAGDLQAGLRVGVLLECFALDVLPIGAARYPDFGPATVAAVAATAGRSHLDAIGPAMVLALLLAVTGGWSLQWLRHANARAVQRRAAALAAGQVRAIAWLQWEGLGRDAARGAALTALGLVGAQLLRHVDVPASMARGLHLAAVGGALAAVAGGAVRGAGGAPAHRRWLAAGFGVGAVASLGLLQ
jgi:PTS system mannose-specific IIC component